MGVAKCTSRLQYIVQHRHFMHYHGLSWIFPPRPAQDMCSTAQIASSQHLPNNRNNLLGSRQLSLCKGDEQPWKYPVAAAGHFANVFSFIFFSNPVSKLSVCFGLLLPSQSSLDPVPVRRCSDMGPNAGACEHRWWFGLEIVFTWDYKEQWY